MNNYELLKGVDSIDRKGYRLYLRSESIKKFIDPLYKVDKSFASFKNSKFYNTGYFSFSSYICESLDKTISYTEYLALNL